MNKLIKVIAVDSVNYLMPIPIYQKYEFIYEKKKKKIVKNLFIMII